MQKCQRSGTFLNAICVAKTFVLHCKRSIALFHLHHTTGPGTFLLLCHLCVLFLNCFRGFFFPFFTFNASGSSFVEFLVLFSFLAEWEKVEAKMQQEQKKNARERTVKSYQV
jgi:hypothetical protein